VAEVKKVEKVEPVASTSTSQMEIPLKVVLDTLEQDTMHPSWYNALKDEFTKPYFAQVGLNSLPMVPGAHGFF
jgi:uracil-DNA glycosylase